MLVARWPPLGASAQRLGLRSSVVLVRRGGIHRMRWAPTALTAFEREPAAHTADYYSYYYLLSCLHTAK